MSYARRSRRRPTSRSSSRSICSSGPRSGAPCASARRRCRSRRRSCAATPTSSPASSSILFATPRRRAGDDAERIYRLRKTCEGGLAAAELAEREDELENRFLATRVTFQGEEMPLRNAQAKLAVLPGYADREELGGSRRRRAPAFNPDRLELMQASEELAADLSGDRRCDRAQRGGEGDLAARALARAASGERRGDAELRDVARALVRAAPRRRPRGHPVSYHTAWMRRLSTLEATYPRERATEICLRTLEALGFDLAAQPNIKLDLDDRPQKSPRACVIASDPPKVVHLITRAQGGLHDYQAFLHEAGHALHYAGCDPNAAVRLPAHLARPCADGDLLVHRRGDLARAGVARAVLRPLGRAGARRTPRRRRSSRRCSIAATRRSCATSSTSGRGSPSTAATPKVYERLLTEATGIRYQRDNYLADMDAGFYSADYLRAWIRSAQLRDHLIGEVGDRLVAQPEHGRAAARLVPRGHEADERGDRRTARLRSARHEAALARDRRVALRYTGARCSAHSSSGLGHRPLTAAARVRIPYGPSRRACHHGNGFVTCVRRGTSAGSGHPGDLGGTSDGLGHSLGRTGV